MHCRTCGDELPEAATFCVACGASILQPTSAGTSRPTPAATGRTVVLDAARIPITRVSSPALTPAPAGFGRTRAAGSCGRGARRKHALHSFPLFMLGIMLLVITGNVWPGILVLLGITGAIDELGRGRARAALARAVFLIGTAVLFFSGTIWPGILIVLVIAALIERR